MKNLVIPFPDNPQHVDNLKSIALLEAQEFEGVDRCLAISLFEYGLVWRTLENEFLFVHRHSSLPDQFERTVMNKNIRPETKWNWADLHNVAETNGLTVEEWLQLPVTQMVFDMVNYYGTENVFGTDYYEGFKIEE